MTDFQDWLRAKLANRPGYFLSEVGRAAEIDRRPLSPEQLARLQERIATLSPRKGKR